MRSCHSVAATFFTVLLLVVFASGCSTVRQPEPRSYRPAYPTGAAQDTSGNGAIYHAAQDIRLFEDVRARRIGDVLTVVLQEKTSASKSANASADKDSSGSLENPILFGSYPQFDLPGGFPLESTNDNTLEMGYKAEREFAGEAEAKQSNSLSGNITVTIADVLPNGNLVVRGEKWLTLNQGEEFIQISGIVRPEDINTNNAILSTQIADAQITYSGKGFLADSNNMGWLAKFFNSPIWPF